MKSMRVLFAVLPLTLLLSCGVGEEKKELATYYRNVILEVDRGQKTANVYEQEALSPDATKKRSIECADANMAAYEEIVRYLTLQPSPKTNKVKAVHAALLDAMQTRLKLAQGLVDILLVMYDDREPSQEMMDNGARLKIACKEKMDIYKELLGDIPK